VIAFHSAPVPSSVTQSGSNLRAVVVARAGYDNVDVEAANGRGVAVVILVILVGRNAPAVAKQVIALILAEVRDSARVDRGIRAGVWPKEYLRETYDLFGCTVGLIGSALNVHDNEPPPEGDPWLGTESATLAPHIAGSTSTWKNSVSMMAEAVREISESGLSRDTIDAGTIGRPG
jgi:phosphoglycerate dehydrogenase-like enzyme